MTTSGRVAFENGMMIKRMRMTMGIVRLKDEASESRGESPRLLDQYFILVRIHM